MEERGSEAWRGEERVTVYLRGVTVWMRPMTWCEGLAGRKEDQW